MAKNIKITQVKSSAHAKQNMKDTLRTLGLRKIPFWAPFAPCVTW